MITKHSDIFVISDRLVLISGKHLETRMICGQMWCLGQLSLSLLITMGNFSVRFWRQFDSIAAIVDFSIEKVPGVRDNIKLWIMSTCFNWLVHHNMIVVIVYVHRLMVISQVHSPKCQELLLGSSSHLVASNANSEVARLCDRSRIHFIHMTSLHFVYIFMLWFTAVIALHLRPYPSPHSTYCLWNVDYGW